MAAPPIPLLICHPDAGFLETLSSVLSAVGYDCLCCTEVSIATSFRQQPQAILVPGGPNSGISPEAIARLHYLFGAPVMLLASKELAANTELLETPGVVRVLANPDARSTSEITGWSRDLVRAVLQMTEEKAAVPGTPHPGAGREVEVAQLDGPIPACIAIGISTGGPAAFGSIWTEVRGEVLPPVFVVQHMPRDFIPPYAARLDRLNDSVHTQVATHGALAEPGNVYIAPGQQHLQIKRAPDGGLRMHISNQPPMTGHRPSADMLFHSLADAGIPTLGVIMTGMGADGAQGLLRLHEQGNHVISQDEATSVVFGMPGATKKLGCVDRFLPLQRIVPYLNRYFDKIQKAKRPAQA